MAATYINKVDKTITAVDDTTDWISSTEQSPKGILDMGIVIDGTWDGIITLQKKQVINGVSTTEVDVEVFATSVQRLIEDHSAGVQYRFKCTTHTAGSAYVEIYK